jgi:NAD(P)H dehydrogenase (quinone)
MKKALIVYHSGYGHTAKVASILLEAMRASPHDLTVDSWTTAEAREKINEIEHYDMIIFGSPTYMGNVSAEFQAFTEASSRVWFEQKWRNKLAAGFTNSGSLSGDKLQSLLRMVVFASQHGMIWVSQGLPSPQANDRFGPSPDTSNRVGSYVGLMTLSDNAPPEEALSPGDQETTRAFGRRLADCLASWNGVA